MDYHLLAGLVADDIDEVRVLFEDGMTSSTVPVGRTIVVLYPANSRIREVVGHRRSSTSAVRCTTEHLPPDVDELRCRGPRSLPAS